MSQQLMHTVCMHTLDGNNKSEGEYEFNLGGDAPRAKAVKLALGSLEFPMVQWTIEDMWSKLYFNEGYFITQNLNTLKISEKTEKQENVVNVMMPKTLNKIENWKTQNGNLIIKTEHPHNLWTENLTSVIPSVIWGEVEIICSPVGRVSLNYLDSISKLKHISNYEFMIPGDGWIECLGIDNDASGFLHIPRIPSPYLLCQFITKILRNATTLSDYVFQYEAEDNKVLFYATRFVENADRLTVTLHGSPLAKLLGFPSIYHEQHFNRSQTITSLEGLTENVRPPLIIPSEFFKGWLHTKLTPGWYAPSHRPMCTGQPLRITQETELSLNRFYFPLPERIPSGMATSHFLVFSDPGGSMHMCSIYPGKYNVESFCKHVEDTMTNLSKETLPGTSFSVCYENKRIIFTCEVINRQNVVNNAPFSLLFGHPAQFDPSRIGFPPITLCGSHCYTSEEIIIPENHEWGHQSNTYRISEIGHQKILKIHALPMPQIHALVMNYDNSNCILHVRTYVGQLPFSHGCHLGDIIRLGKSSDAELLIQDNDTQRWEEGKFPGSAIAPRWGRSGIVVKFHETKNDQPYDLFIKIRRTPDLSCECDTVMLLQTEVQPFNLCFGNLHQSITPQIFGFKKGATQWGIDGSVSNGILKMPPFDAPCVHSLEHPDYVLVHLNEGKQGHALQHTFSNSTSMPLCKLVLYPLFREERMLPRETTLLSGESLNKFTLKFTNPDGSPYHFHGAHFSFSLNFVYG